MSSISSARNAPLTTGRTLDHAARVYDLLAPLMTLGMEGRLRRAVLHLLVLAGTERVLDVGCGTGSLTLAISRRLGGAQGSCAVGVDAAPRMIDVARRKAVGAHSVTFDVEAAESLPYPDASFDRVVSTFFFHHVSFGLKVRALDHMHRVLVPGGYAVIVDVDRPTNLWGALCAWCGYILFQQDEIRENIRGRLTEAFAASEFRQWMPISHHSGYISVFRLVKQDNRPGKGHT